MQDALTALGAALAAGDADAVRREVTAEPDLLTWRTATGSTALHLAVAIATAGGAIPSQDGPPGILDSIRALVEVGAALDAVDADGMTPLHCATFGHHPKLVTLLRDAGAPRDGALLGQRHGSPLALALFYANTAIAELLAEPPVPDDLRTAASLGRDLDRFLADDGALTAQARAGITFRRPLAAFPAAPASDPGDPPSDQHVLDDALTYAARHGQLGSLAWLVDHGADVDANPYRGTPLLWAAYADRVDAATWLLDRGADPDLLHDFGGSEHGTGATAMHLAAQYGSTGVLDLLLARGADHTLRDEAFDSTPFGWAGHEGTAPSLEVFAAHGVTA